MFRRSVFVASEVLGSLLDLKFESAWTMVPGTMLMWTSRARDWYFSIQIFQSKAWAVSAVESGTQPVRWYSGRTASSAPWAEASRMN